MRNLPLYKWITVCWFCCLWVVGYAQQPPPEPTPPPVTSTGGGESPIDPQVQAKLNQNSSSAEPTEAEGTDTNEDNKDSNEGENEEKEEKKLTKEEEDQIKFDLRQSNLPEAKIWGQNFFRDQTIDLFTRSRDISNIDKYILGVGDELTITVWGATDYSTNVAIEEDGSIDLTDPRRGTHLPRLYLKEMRYDDARGAIEQWLKNHMNVGNSQLSIKLNYSRSMTINITGEVFNPGSYTIPAVNTAFNALVAAGGPSQIGSVRMIRVVSGTKPTRLLDVYQFMNNPLVADEFYLDNNDYIFVPLAQRVVQIEGSIERPYFYELIDGEGLVELIEHAGGLTPDAYRRNIQIIRYENDEELLIDVNLARVLADSANFILKDGDRIKINPIEQAFANYVTVEGAVKLPGTYQLEPGTRISDVLSKSGIVLSAVMDRIYVKRLREDLSLQYIPINIYEVLRDTSSKANILLRPFDEIEVKYKSDFIDKYSVSIHGAVRKPGEFEFSNNLTLYDVVYMANGLRLEASNSRVEVSRLVLDSTDNTTRIIFKRLQVVGPSDNLRIKGAKDFKLEPYDQIFVRTSKDFEAPKNIVIVGEVYRPGSYTLANDKERVMDVIDRAGGWTEIAFLEGAKLMRKGDGLVLLNLAELKRDGRKSCYNYVLRKDDRIIIPKLKDLVSIGGRINHPAVQERVELANRELELELERVETDLEKKELLLEVYKKELENPTRVNVPFHAGRRANYYIREYGAGIDRKQGGRQRLVYVRYANGMVKKSRGFLFFRTYPKVEKGALVYVGAKEKKIRPPREPVNWHKIVTDSMALIVSGLSIYALIEALTRNNNKKP